MTAKKLENNSNHAVIAEEVKILTDLLDESTRHLVGDEEFAKIKGLVKIAASSDHSQLESQIACFKQSRDDHCRPLLRDPAAFDQHY